MDCSICCVAMVMGQAYSYERVLIDSLKYPKTSAAGYPHAWWETYLADEGFLASYRPFHELYDLPQFGGHRVGLLVFMLPDIQFGHIVAVDELGVIDPATGALPHMDITDYVCMQLSRRAVFDNMFLAVENPR